MKLIGKCTYRSAALVAVVALVGGCQTLNSFPRDSHPEQAPPAVGRGNWQDQPPMDLLAAHEIKVECAPTDQVTLSLPAVWQNGSQLVVVGTVTRKTGTNAPIPGLVDLFIVSRNGTLLAKLGVALKPQQDPIHGVRSSSYQLNYVPYPPAGSTLWVVYRDKPEQR